MTESTGSNLRTIDPPRTRVCEYFQCSSVKRERDLSPPPSFCSYVSLIFRHHALPPFHRTRGLAPHCAANASLTFSELFLSPSTTTPTPTARGCTHSVHVDTHTARTPRSVPRRYTHSAHAAQCPTHKNQKVARALCLSFSLWVSPSKSLCASLSQIPYPSRSLSIPGMPSPSHSLPLLLPLPHSSSSNPPAPLSL